MSVVFYVVFGAVCVGGVGIIAVGSLLFKSGNIILGNFNIRQGVDDTLFFHWLECKVCADIF